MKDFKFIIKEQKNTKFMPKDVAGQIYPSYAIIDGVSYQVASGAGKTTDYLYDSMLNMYISGDELLPVPNKNLKADYSFMPEIVNAKQEIKYNLDKGLENLQKIKRKIQNSKKNKEGLDKLANEILSATDQYLDKTLTALSPLKTIIDPVTKEMYPVFNVHLTIFDSDDSEVRKDVIVSNGADSIPLKNQMVDTGAKIPLTTPDIPRNLNLQPTKKVVLAGITEDQFLTEAVPMRITIDGHTYETLVAIFPRLRAITNSDFLIDGSLFNKSSGDGVQYGPKH